MNDAALKGITSIAAVLLFLAATYAYLRAGRKLIQQLLPPYDRDTQQQRGDQDGR